MPEPPASAGKTLSGNDLDRVPTAAPVKLGVALLVGFLIGVFVMFVLRTEMRHLRDSAGKFALLLGLASVLALSLIPPWLRLRRLLHATFPRAQAEALLHGIVVLLWAGVVLVTVVCGLLFLAVA